MTSPPTFPTLRTLAFGTLTLALATNSVTAQSVEERLEALENENAELRNRLDSIDGRSGALEDGFDAIGREIERLEFRDIIPKVGESKFGLGPGASKVYGIEQGISIGGYGEFLYQHSPDAIDNFDALRVVTYLGYKFTDKWVFNSELELEHGSTTAQSGTTASSGSFSVEFATLDYLYDPALNFRAGVVLPPLGFINELHEPTTFLSARRPRTETRIIPTTFRSPGVGIFGETDNFEYRTYLVSSLNGENFTSAGLRGGRQQANREAAEDFAWTGRLDFVGIDDLKIGGSFYVGETGQDGVDTNGNSIPDLPLGIFGAHVEYRPGPWWFRALYTTAVVGDSSEFNTNTGQNLARRQHGVYGEVGVDVLALGGNESGQSLTPFFRYEYIDTQRELAAGFSPEPRSENIWTLGVNYKPIQEIVFKVDYEASSRGPDYLNVLFGYVF
ncbi:MAG: hypothetical protein AAF196_20355 [Planctomycetota bacterium]